MKFGFTVMNFAIGLEVTKGAAYGDFGRLQFALEGKLPRIGQSVQKDLGGWSGGRSHRYTWQGGSLMR